MPESKTNDGFEGKPDDPISEEKWFRAKILIVHDEIEEATSADALRRAIARAILLTGRMTQEERRRLSDQALKPWVGSVGKRPNDDRTFQIYARYIIPIVEEKKRNSTKLPELSRAAALVAIAKEYRLTPDAARKAYDKARLLDDVPFTGKDRKK